MACLLFGPGVSELSRPGSELPGRWFFKAGLVLDPGHADVDVVERGPVSTEVRLDTGEMAVWRFCDVDLNPPCLQAGRRTHQIVFRVCLFGRLNRRPFLHLFPHVFLVWSY